MANASVVDFYPEKLRDNYFQRRIRYRRIEFRIKKFAVRKTLFLYDIDQML